MIHDNIKFGKRKIGKSLKLGDGAAQAIGQIASTGMNMINSNQDRQFNKGQAREADARAAGYSKELIDYKRASDMQMWRDTNYSAQIEEMKKAGVNPAMLYGGGSGGQAMTSGGAPSGQGTASHHKTPEMNSFAITQALMAAAQIENIKADTNLKNSQADKTAGVDTEETKARIADLTQGIENKKAQEKLTKAETFLTDMQGYIANGSKDDAIGQIKWSMRRAEQEVYQAENETYISDQTIKDKITIIKAEGIGALLKNDVLREEAGLKKEQQEEIKARINKMQADIAQNAQRLGIEATRAKITEFAEEIKAQYPSISNVIGNWADEAVRIITKGMTGETDRHQRQYNYKD